MSQVMRGLVVELNPRYRNEWQMEHEKPMGNRLARCTIRAVREHVEEKRFKQILEKFKKGMKKAKKFND